MYLYWNTHLWKLQEVAQYFSVLKENNCQPGILYIKELLSRNKGSIKIFSDKGKQRNLFLADLPINNV
jgi:hypothetical protein